MTDEAVVRALHEGPARGVFAVTGGGSLLLSDLLGVPGASGTVVYGAVPYGRVGARGIHWGNTGLRVQRRYGA